MSDFKDLTVADLRAYALEQHGLEFPAKMTKAEMIAAIQAQPGEESTAPTGAGSATDGHEGKTPIKVVLNIPDDGASMRINYHIVNVNGTNYQIQKGKDVTVPYGVYDCLNNAVERRLVQVPGEGGHYDFVERDVRRIPFHVVEFIYED